MKDFFHIVPIQSAAMSLKLVGIGGYVRCGGTGINWGDGSGDRNA